MQKLAQSLGVLLQKKTEEKIKEKNQDRVDGAVISDSEFESDEDDYQDTSGDKSKNSVKKEMVELAMFDALAQELEMLQTAYNSMKSDLEQEKEKRALSAASRSCRGGDC